MLRFTRLRLSRPWRTLASSVVAGISLIVLNSASYSAEAIATGPQTEKRFPPLVIPAGFKATLFACDPLVEYPSVIAVGPKAGTLFVAHDYMTGLGTEIIRRDEIRLLADTNGDGYADRSTVYAKGFNSLQGLAYWRGSVYAMHAPFLTVLRDTNGDGVADERRDLLTGLGLPPEKNSNRLHCANGVTAGHDGWLYLAIGDQGVDVPRPEGDRLVLQGGGILRCRTDGRQLHIFSTGLRNIYDVVLDDQLNVFVRDNENDGGDYMIRVCHSFLGADHGYPYLFQDHPDEAMPPLADLGRGSSAGGTCYLETTFPPEYRGNLFFCEWGRAVVRYKREQARSADGKTMLSGFAKTKEIDFVSGAPTDPYGFKPTDVIVDYDGSMLISDWCDGQRPKRGRGRIYRVAWNGPSEKTAVINDVNSPDTLVANLNSPSYYTRIAAQEKLEAMGEEGRRLLFQSYPKLNMHGRTHGLWMVAAAGHVNLRSLFASRVAQEDPDPAVRVQAIRAGLDSLGLIHRDAKSSGNQTFAPNLFDRQLLPGIDSRLKLEAVLALGRLQSQDAPELIRLAYHDRDPALEHAAQQALRLCRNWPGVLKLLDEPPNAAVRKAALHSLAEEARPEVVDGLLARLQKSKDSQQKQEYAALLARVARKPGPWKYWGYRPGPRPANSVAWERTSQIDQALNQLLTDTDKGLRAHVLRQMLREKVPAGASFLLSWLTEEKDPQRLSLVLDALVDAKAPSLQTAMDRLIRDQSQISQNRIKATALLCSSLTSSDEQQLIKLASDLEEGPVLANLLREIVKRPTLKADELLLSRLQAKDGSVRAASLTALSDLKIVTASHEIPRLLEDQDLQVRRAAIRAAGVFAAKKTAPQLLKLAEQADAETRVLCLESLRKLKEPNAIPLAVSALRDRETQLAALELLGELGSIEQSDALLTSAASSRSLEFLNAIVRTLSQWRQRTGTTPAESERIDALIARMQGENGVLLAWKQFGPVVQDQANQQRELALAPLSNSLGQLEWQSSIARESDGRVDLIDSKTKSAGRVWLATTAFRIPSATKVELIGTRNGTMQVWLNGKPLPDREPVVLRSTNGLSVPAADVNAVLRWETALPEGNNRILVQVENHIGPPRFQIQIRRLCASSEHERLIKFLHENASAGDPNRGRELFFNQEKSLCMKCHRLSTQGGTVGPDLTGVGSRFSRMHLIESILEPSRTIAPSYETVSLELVSGLTAVGVKVKEDERTITLADDQGKLRVIPKSEVEGRSIQNRSIMPDGLEKRFTEREFLDLVSYLSSQRKNSPP